MRKRWEVPEGFLWVLGGIWGFGWLPIFLTLWALIEPDGLSAKGTPNPIPVIFEGVWFGVPLMAALVWFLPKGFVWVWNNRPHRVLENSPDIREVYREDDKDE